LQGDIGKARAKKGHLWWILVSLKAFFQRTQHWLKKLTKRLGLVKMIHYHMYLPQPLNEGEDTKYVNDECWLTQNF
jgi:hypothetical protein